jgi:threonine dehydrogenase-like Zn-dependent dehydrogenase
MRLEQIPEPNQIPPGWVKIRVLVVQPSITETMLFRGFNTSNLDKITRTLKNGPYQLFGHEYSAQVVAVGDGVHDLKSGDRVASRSLSSCGECYLCRNGRREECQKGPITGFDIPGCFAEYAVVPADTLVPLPDTITDSEGAALQPLCEAVAGVAAAQIKLGDTCVVIGQGVMGLGCMQTARVSGAGTVIGIANRDQTIAMSQKLGADITIDTRKTDPVAFVTQITKGKGADVVIETAGGPPDQGLAGAESLNKAAEMVCDNGTVVGISLFGDATVLPYARFRHRCIKYVFPSVLTRNLLSHVVKLVATGRVQLKPTLSAPLEGIESVPKAFELTENKKLYELISPAQVVISKQDPL